LIPNIIIAFSTSSVFFPHKRGRHNGQKTKSPLTKDQICRLDSLGFVWNVKNSKRKQPPSSNQSARNKRQCKRTPVWIVCWFGVWIDATCGRHSAQAKG